MWMHKRSRINESMMMSVKASLIAVYALLKNYEVFNIRHNPFKKYWLQLGFSILVPNANPGNTRFFFQIPRDPGNSWDFLKIGVFYPHTPCGGLGPQDPVAFRLNPPIHLVIGYHWFVYQYFDKRWNKKIVKLFLHTFQNIAHHLGQKKLSATSGGGGGVCILLSRTE